jgi:hypothetical protein
VIGESAQYYKYGISKEAGEYTWNSIFYFFIYTISIKAMCVKFNIEIENLKSILILFLLAQSAWKVI